MKVCKGYGSTLFISKYDSEHNLVQKLTNVVAGDDNTHNRPVDFLETGLAPLNCSDEWTRSFILSICTDEAVPPRVNEIAIGGNHGHPCAIDVIHYAHGKTCRDVGSVWRDEKGVIFYLVQVPNDDVLTFVSENVGVSKDKYDFVLSVTGKLTYVKSGLNTLDVCPINQVMRYLTPAIKHEKLDLFIVKDGKRERVIKDAEGDLAQIREVYDVINPATVGPALEKNRPEGGYEKAPLISEYGEKMLHYDATYNILDDGTYLNDFNLQKTSGATFTSYMGVMAQERRDYFGGGVYRFMPKTLPFTTPEGTFDFSRPKNMDSPFPKKHLLGKESWTNPDNPPNRVVDILRDKDGHNKMGYTLGYLPLYDGTPEIRKDNLSYSVDIRNSLKLYPLFKDYDIDNARGVAYKKYFKIDKDEGYFYTINFEGVKYIYCDTFAPTKLEIPVENKVELLEISNEASYLEKDGKIIVESTSNNPQYAVFKCKV